MYLSLGTNFPLAMFMDADMYLHRCLSCSYSTQINMKPSEGTWMFTVHDLRDPVATAKFRAKFKLFWQSSGVNRGCGI